MRPVISNGRVIRLVVPRRSTIFSCLNPSASVKIKGLDQIIAVKEIC